LGSPGPLGVRARLMSMSPKGSPKQLTRAKRTADVGRHAFGGKGWHNNARLARTVCCTDATKAGCPPPHLTLSRRSVPDKQ
jgi:hypothetical protein